MFNRNSAPAPTAPQAPPWYLQPAPGAPVFQYLTLPFSDANSNDEIQQLLDQLGAVGWELVTNAQRADATDSTIGLTALGMTTAVKAPKGGQRGVFLLIFRRRVG